MLRRLLLIIIICGLTFPPCLGAETASIVNFNLVNSKGLIKVSAKLRGTFDRDVVDALRKGVTTVFTYYLELKKVRPLWHIWYLGLDDKIYSREIKKIGKYNVLKKEYKFTVIDGGKNQEKIVSSLEELRQLMTNLDNVTIVPVSFLNKGEKYYVRIKAEMRSLKLWFPFNYIFFFFPLLTNFETTWQESSPLVIE